MKMYVLPAAATLLSFIAISALHKKLPMATSSYPQSAQPGTKSLYFGLMMSFGLERPGFIPASQPHKMAKIKKSVNHPFRRLTVK